MSLAKYEKDFRKKGWIVSGDVLTNARGDVLAGTDPYGHLWFREEEVAEVIRNYVEHTAEENKPKEVKGKTDVRKKKKSD